MMTHLLTIAQLELTAAARLKWIRLLTAAFALLAAAAAYSAGAANEMSGADGFARTTMALVPVVLILVPLVGADPRRLGSGVRTGQRAVPVRPARGPRDRVSSAAGSANPSRSAARSSTGLGIGGAIVAFGSGTEGLWRFVFFVIASVVLADDLPVDRRGDRGGDREARGRARRRHVRLVLLRAALRWRRALASPAGSPDRSADGSCLARCSAIRRT